MAILLRGTTRQRAERILAHGPDPRLTRQFGYSTCLESGPFPLGTPKDYAVAQASAYKGEGGAAIIAFDVPDPIIALATDEYFPLSQGVVQFDEGAGLAELIDAWPTLWKEIRPAE